MGRSHTSAGYGHIHQLWEASYALDDMGLSSQKAVRLSRPSEDARVQLKPQT